MLTPEFSYGKAGRSVEGARASTSAGTVVARHGK